MNRNCRSLSAGALLACLAGGVNAHGLIEDPPSRNWYCGAVTKPDEIDNGTAEYEECRGAFAQDPVGGYQFMSVLTHAQGRAVVDPLPEHVCGFGSETWQGGATPWDSAIDWPTSQMSPGLKTFTWNISWGPHFDDTEEFRYWITKPGFQFQSGRPLTWDDFEEEAFCVLNYDDKNPDANPNVEPDKANARFRTTCDIPERSGRHVIYGEWGRNQYTFERFHGCVDVVFDGTDPGDSENVFAKISLTPNVSEFTGAGELRLDAGESQGEGLSYQWSVSSQNPGLYELEGASQKVATLRMANPETAGRVTISLHVSNADESDDASVAITHLPAGSSPWLDLGALTAQPMNLAAGDKVSVRVVLQDGRDLYYPAQPLALGDADSAAAEWPYALAQAVNAAGAEIKVGVVNADSEVNPVRDPVANKVYAKTDAAVANAYLQVKKGGDEPAADCAVDYDVVNEWDGGFHTVVTVTNNSDEPVRGYELAWTLAAGESFDYGWNANFSAEGAGVTAAVPATQWNGTLAANGGTSTFGFIGKKGAASASVPAIIKLNGSECGQ
ncbi:hypothetical protein EUZ85_05845 [Hahella sp. KA22]|uniref:lytic polysaccharide monooxygenase n=1 Tax=Hahella sp. KA22 TaxID=1628392 RepID=UPI000FDF3052|nr:lytic polysaccharide monooxygenase [Hahella sp. KA22]AZZ90263.1 hypothetical protein ENC22_03295 [Hahella sp. KA22]QAY53633.1 hypothetical protein EUZ85_05845 [Hahella sp. KA22]